MEEQVKHKRTKSLLWILCLVISIVNFSQWQIFAERSTEFDPSKAQSIEIVQEPEQKEYLYRYDKETIDLDGLIVRVTYQDGTSKEIPASEFDQYGITTEPKQGSRPTSSTSNLVVSVNGIRSTPISLEMVYSYTSWIRLDIISGDTEANTVVGSVTVNKSLTSDLSKTVPISVKNLKYPVIIKIIDSPDNFLRTGDLAVKSINGQNKIVTTRFIPSAKKLGSIRLISTFDGITDPNVNTVDISESIYWPINKKTFSKIGLDLPNLIGEIPSETILSEKIEAIDSKDNTAVDKARIELKEPNEFFEIQNGKLIVKKGKTLLPGAYAFELKANYTNYEEKIGSFTLNVGEKQQNTFSPSTTSPIRPNPISKATPPAPAEPKPKENPAQKPSPVSDKDHSRSSVRPDHSELIGEDGLPLDGLDPHRKEKVDSASKVFSNSKVMGTNKIMHAPKTGVQASSFVKRSLVYGTVGSLMILAIDLRNDRRRK